MGRLPQTTEASTREDCTGASRDVSENPDAVGSSGDLHAALHLLPHDQFRGDREGEGQCRQGPWRTQVYASQSIRRNCQNQAWAGERFGWCQAWSGEVSGGAKDCHCQRAYCAKTGLAKGLLGAKLGLARSVLRPVAGIKKAKLSALRGLLDRKISLLDF